MNLDLLKDKEFYKFTGPPENWITAIKYMTWGLEEKYKERWAQILPGDIFLMHSTSTGTRVKGARSAIIGFGVVGTNPTIKTGPLWLQELEESTNRWPLLVPFSEIYLFSPYFEKHTVPDPTLQNISQVAGASLEILDNSIPLASITGFPQMGSFASVRPEVVSQIFKRILQAYVIGSAQARDYVSTPLLKLDNVKQQNRYSISLQNLDFVKTKTFKAKGSSFTKDPVLLERADNAHQLTVDRLMNLFKAMGYDTYFNKHVDLFATNGHKSYLFEVKSNENKNFLPQARKGIVQLFEYEHFEIQKFQKDNKLKTTVYKNLTFSQKPANPEYADFMNSLNLGVTYFEKYDLKALGREIGLAGI